MSFTRSTTDLKVHQSLSDYPNVEDGLSAEELKKKFDAPAEQLQKDLNKLVDELEDVGAERIGAKALTAGDNTAPNVYSKLLYLLEQIQSAILGQLPDGSITKSKIETKYAEKIAEKDGSLQQGLNAELLEGSTKQEIIDTIGIFSETRNVTATKKISQRKCKMGFCNKG